MSKVGVGSLRDVGTLLLEAIDDVEFAEAAMEEGGFCDVGVVRVGTPGIEAEDVEFGAGCVPNIGTPWLEAIEAEDDADGGSFFLNDVDVSLACKNKLDLIFKNDFNDSFKDS